MRKRNRKILSNITFIDAGAKGVAIGKTPEGKTVMVKNAIPGDVADVLVQRKRRNYLEGKAQNFTTLSSYRTTPKCEHFGTCGGCKWQNMKYDKQLYFKEKEVYNNVKKIAKIEDFTAAPILPSKQEYLYRNKMEFSFSNSRWITQEEIESKEEITHKNALGFHLPKMWSKILHLSNCYLQEEPSNSIRNYTHTLAQELQIPYFDVYNHSGVLRTLMLKNNHVGEYMLVFQLYEDFPEREQFFNDILAKFPQIKTLLYAINSKQNDSIYDLDIQTYVGNGYLEEQMEELQFRITAKSFFQTNYTQAIELYKLTRKYADLQGNEVVYDLYTGTGTIAQFIAKNAKKVIGIESVSEAVEAAIENAQRNNINNCDFFCGDMKEIFTQEFVQQNGKPDIIITDPPRDGMHKKVVENILQLAPTRIVYVSCNSATQARDLEMLKQKYRLSLIHPVDMFPQTHHVESIAVLDIL